MTPANLPAKLAAALAAAAITLTAQAAGPHTVNVGAVVLSNSNCRFSNGTSTLDFGAIDPSSSSNVTASVNIQYRCNGGAPVASWAISSNDGLYETGPNAPRMRHATTPTQFLAYTLNVPASGTAPRNTNMSFTLTGTIVPASFGTAIAGAYADSVVLSITP